MLLLETSRLVLRPFHADDLTTFATYRSDPLIARYQSWNTPYTLAQAQAFLADIQATTPGQPGAWFQLAVERKAQPGLIGDCGFHVRADDARQAEIGYTLAPACHGQGYATEFVTAVLRYLFNDLHLHRVSATCDAENTASARLLERVGMRREAHFVQNIWFKGAWGSEYAYALLASEWAPR